jgi:hypothetical protein
MLMLILGFFSLSFFTFLAILTVNYSIYLWENERINNLISQVKREKIDEILARKKEKGFTAKDLNKNLQYPQGLSLKEGLFSDGKNIKNIFNLQTLNSLLKQFINFLRGLTRPPKNDYYDPLAEDKLKEMRTSKDKISDENRIDDIFYNNSISFGQDEENISENQDKKYNYNIKNNSKNLPTHKIKKTKPLENITNQYDFLQDDIQDQREFEEDINPKKNQESEEGINFEDDSESATLNFAANESNQNQKKQTLFKKMEDQILEELKEKGLNRYDIWLKLAQLYEKYAQQKKAVEVYAMILKHSKTEEKIIARNKLIALA